MNDEVKTIVQECTQGSDVGRLTFPQVVGKLMQAGVERYHADLCRGERTYYLPSGESCVVTAAKNDGAPAQTFSPSGIDAALRAVQSRSIAYREFCERILAAGCVDYVVSLAGRRAVYFGRGGETHVEPFPNAT